MTTTRRPATLLLAVALAFAPTFAGAQSQPGRADAVPQTVRGVLAESGTNAPVAGAIITLRSERGEAAGRTLTEASVVYR
jgi:hypothetical protein